MFTDISLGVFDGLKVNLPNGSPHEVILSWVPRAMRLILAGGSNEGANTWSGWGGEPLAAAASGFNYRLPYSPRPYGP